MSRLEPSAKSLSVQTPTQQRVGAKKATWLLKVSDQVFISDSASDKILIPKALCYKSLHDWKNCGGSVNTVLGSPWDLRSPVGKTPCHKNQSSSKATAKHGL